MKKVVFVTLFFLLLSSSQVFAESEYVLPYPSYMPGSKLYLFQEFKNNVAKFWYFGSLGRFTYHLNMADKYLVEAKTLFEYKQYLLAHRALIESNSYFSQIPNDLSNAKKENKNISEKNKILSQATLKHIEVLQVLKQAAPSVFTWKPEKSPPTIIYIQKDIDEAIKLRTDSL